MLEFSCPKRSNNSFLFPGCQILSITCVVQNTQLQFMGMVGQTITHIGHHNIFKGLLKKVNDLEDLFRKLSNTNLFLISIGNQLNVKAGQGCVDRSISEESLTIKSSTSLLGPKKKVAKENSTVEQQNISSSLRQLENQNS